MIYSNIKDQVLEEIQSEKEFATPPTHEVRKKDFTFLAKKFLEADSYLKMERYGRLLMQQAFKYHGKSESMGSMLELLNNYENYFDYNFQTRQKLHFSHLAHVFLLGLFLYHNVPTIEMCFKTRYEIKHDISLQVKGCKEKIIQKLWNYSGGEVFTEILYRWRLTSLMHDIGNPIAQAEGDTEKLHAYLEEFRVISGIRIDEIESIKNYKSKFLNYKFPENDLSVKSYNFQKKVPLSNTILEILDKSIENVNLINHIKIQETSPRYQVYNDHGIYGALIFLILTDNVYLNHDNKHRTRTNFWHPFIFQKSILDSARAIAMHNLDQHENALRDSLINKNDLQIFDLEKEPLAWLLKVSDILQEWDKPKKSDFTKPPMLTPIKITFDGNKIELHNYGDKKESINEAIQKYTKGPVEFIWID